MSTKGREIKKIARGKRSDKSQLHGVLSWFLLSKYFHFTWFIVHFFFIFLNLEFASFYVVTKLSNLSFTFVDLGGWNVPRGLLKKWQQIVFVLHRKESKRYHDRFFFPPQWRCWFCVYLQSHNGSEKNIRKISLDLTFGMLSKANKQDHLFTIFRGRMSYHLKLFRYSKWIFGTVEDLKVGTPDYACHGVGDDDFYCVEEMWK